MLTMAGDQHPPAPRRDIPEGVSVQRAAFLLDVHENTIRNWIVRGYLVAERFGPRLLRIPRAELARVKRLREDF